MNPQQTLELAIDLHSGRRIPASELLTMPEVEFSDIRRAAMSDRVERCKNGVAPSVVR